MLSENMQKRLRFKFLTKERNISQSSEIQWIFKDISENLNHVENSQKSTSTPTTASRFKR